MELDRQHEAFDGWRIRNTVPIERIGGPRLYACSCGLTCTSYRRAWWHDWTHPQRWRAKLIGRVPWRAAILGIEPGSGPKAAREA